MKAKRNLLLDFGQVLTSDHDWSVYAPLLERWRLAPQNFAQAWARHRLGYDGGQLQASEYWQRVLADSRPEAADAATIELGDADIKWIQEIDLSAFSRPRAAVHALVEDCFRQDIPVGILSNMPSGHGERWLQLWPRLRGCAVCLWSGEEKVLKPSAEIFRLLLARSGWLAADTLFVDDVRANIDAAAALGFATLHFTDETGDVKQAREWLGL